MRALVILALVAVGATSCQKDTPKQCDPLGEWEVHQVSEAGACWQAGLDYWDDFTISEDPLDPSTYDIKDNPLEPALLIGGSYQDCHLHFIAAGHTLDESFVWKITRDYDLSGFKDELVTGDSLFEIKQNGVTCTNGFLALGTRHLLENDPPPSTPGRVRGHYGLLSGPPSP